MAEPIKFKCYKCKGEVEVDAALSGFSVACPHCEVPLTVPVMMSTSATTHTKIKLKVTTPGHLKVEDPEAALGGGGLDEPEEEEIEYVEIIEEPPSKRKLLVGLGAALALLVAAVLLFFGVRSYVSHVEQVKAERQRAQEEAANLAAKVEKEMRLQPVWDDALALAERTMKSKTNVDNTVSLFENLVKGDFAGTKFEAKANDELKRLNVLKEELAAEHRKNVQEDAAQQKPVAQPAQTPKPAAPPVSAQPAQTPKPAAAPVAPVAAPAQNPAAAQLAAASKDLGKLVLKGDWKGAVAALPNFPDKTLATAFKPVFDTIMNQDKLVMDSFEADEGKEVEITFKSGKETLKIIAVKANGQIQASQKFEKAVFQKNFSESDIAPSEKLERIGRYNSDAASLLQASSFYVKQGPGDALKTIETMDAKSKTLDALRGFMKLELSEAVAAEEYEELLAKLHLKAAMSVADMKTEIAKAKIYAQPAKDELKQAVTNYQTTHKDSAYIKLVAPKLTAMAQAIDAIKIIKQAPAGTVSNIKPNLGDKPVMKK